MGGLKLDGDIAARIERLAGAESLRWDGPVRRGSTKQVMWGVAPRPSEERSGSGMMESSLTRDLIRVLG